MHCRLNTLRIVRYFALFDGSRKKTITVVDGKTFEKRKILIRCQFFAFIADLLIGN